MSTFFTVLGAPKDSLVWMRLHNFTCMKFNCITKNSWEGKNKKNANITEQEFLFYWLNLSLQEDSCIAKTEPGTSSSAVVIYSLKLHKNHDALKYSYVTGQKDTGTPLQHVTIWIGWGGSGGWLRRWEGSRGRWRMTNAHLTF